METQTFAFCNALKLLKEGKGVTRKGWSKPYVVRVQVPDENSKMGHPYLYVDATAFGGKMVPWTPNQQDILAEDWQEATN